MAQCPVSFVPYQGACIRECPEARSFYLSIENGQPRCIYTGDRAVQVRLNPVSGINIGDTEELPTLEELREMRPSAYTRFKRESDRADAALTIEFRKVDRTSQLDTAFRSLQDAEGVRDESPEAYQMARIAYYTLAKGAGWLDEERQRVLASEIDPEVNNYRKSYEEVTGRREAQQRTQDVMRAVKDGVLSMKDDVQYTTKAFQDQIETLKNQINIERRGREKPSSDGGFFAWIDTILNLLIVISLIFVGLTLWRKMSPVPGPEPISLRLVTG
jgi:hypothetical protein